MNSIRVLANKEFLVENPAAARLFESIELPLDDVNAAILQQREGEDTIEQIRGHAEKWVEGHSDEFDAWVEETKSAAEKIWFTPAARRAAGVAYRRSSHRAQTGAGSRDDDPAVRGCDALHVPASPGLPAQRRHRAREKAAAQD